MIKVSSWRLIVLINWRSLNWRLFCEFSGLRQKREQYLEQNCEVNRKWSIIDGWFYWINSGWLRFEYLWSYQIKSEQFILECQKVQIVKRQLSVDGLSGRGMEPVVTLAPQAPSSPSAASAAAGSNGCGGSSGKKSGSSSSVAEVVSGGGGYRHHQQNNKQLSSNAQQQSMTVSF